MPSKGKSNRNKWKHSKKLKTAMMKKSRREKGKKIARWMTGKIGIQRGRETRRESET
jgi:hypothetical protein